MLFAILLVATSCSASGLLAATLFAALGLVVLVLIGVGGLLGLATLGLVIIIVVVLIVVVAVLVVLLDHLEVVLERQGDELVLELVGHVEVLVHQLGDVLLGLLLVVLGLLGRLALGQLLLVGHLPGLEEVEETLLLHGLGDGLAWLALLGLLLLLNLLLCHILAVLPVDLRALALLYHVLVLGHHEGLLDLGVLEVVVLLEGEDQVEAVARVVQVALDVQQVHQNGAILFLYKSGDAGMVEHGAHPEAWHSEGAVLDFLHVAGDVLELLEVLVVELLRTRLIGLDQLVLGGLGTREDLATLRVDLLVEFVVLELEGTVQSLLFVVDLALVVLKASF